MRKPGLIKRFLRFVGRWFFICGLIALVVGLGFAIYRSIFILRCVSASGTVIRLDEVPDENNGAVNFAPVFSFTAADGKSYTIRSGTSSNPPEFDTGQVVRVLYVKSNPGRAVISSTLQLWLVTLILSGLGVFYTGLGYMLLRFTRSLGKMADSAIPAPQVSSS